MDRWLHTGCPAAVGPMAQQRTAPCQGQQVSSCRGCTRAESSAIIRKAALLTGVGKKGLRPLAAEPELELLPLEPLRGLPEEEPLPAPGAAGLGGALRERWRECG